MRTVSEGRYDPLEVLSGHIDLAMKHALKASTMDPKVRVVRFKKRTRPELIPSFRGHLGCLCHRFRGRKLPHDRYDGVYSPTCCVTERDGSAEGGHRWWALNRLTLPTPVLATRKKGRGAKKGKKLRCVRTLRAKRARQEGAQLSKEAHRLVAGAVRERSRRPRTRQHTPSTISARPGDRPERGGKWGTEGPASASFRLIDVPDWDAGT